MEFICYSTGDEEGSRNVDVEDLPKCRNGVVTCIALSRDRCAGDKATDRVTEGGTDGGEG